MTLYPWFEQVFNKVWGDTGILEGGGLGWIACTQQLGVVYFENPLKAVGIQEGGRKQKRQGRKEERRETYIKQSESVRWNWCYRREERQRGEVDVRQCFTTCGEIRRYWKEESEDQRKGEKFLQSCGFFFGSGGGVLCLLLLWQRWSASWEELSQ